MRDSRTALLLLALAQPAAAQWNYVSSGTTSELRGLSLAPRGVVGASGGRGTVVRSTDGGRTWQADTIAGASTLDFRAVHGFDASGAIAASAGIAAGGDYTKPRLAATSRDGGNTWTRRTAWQ